MNLAALRNEVLSKGFDPQVFGSRITQYLNDAQNLIARRVDYYRSETTWTTQTVAGQAAYTGPGNVARIRDISDTDLDRSLAYVSTRDIDNSSNAQGRPAYYAVTGLTVQLYPVPDAVYNLQLRYWAMPPKLVNDDDEPTLPDDWGHMLWVYATSICYEAEDDPQMAGYYLQRFNTELSMFTADQKFPTADEPAQAESMWTTSPGGAWIAYIPTAGGGEGSEGLDGGSP